MTGLARDFWDALTTVLRVVVECGALLLVMAASIGIAIGVAWVVDAIGFLNFPIFNGGHQ